MTKLFFAVSLFGLALSVPASAMDAMMCDEATMTKMQSDMDAMTDPAMSANKDMAMKEMDQAKTAMTGTKTDECLTHLRQAKAAMMCNDTGMAQMQTDLGTMTDATKKDAAMKESDQAMTAMKAGKMDECVTHLSTAMQGMSTTQ